MTREEFIDPYNAPEFRVSGVAWRELIGTEWARSVFFLRDGNQSILQFKMLIPLEVMIAEHHRARDFVTHQTLNGERTWEGLYVPRQTRLI